VEREGWENELLMGYCLNFKIQYLLNLLEKIPLMSLNKWTAL
jgi:hypothetical protein